MAHKPPTLGQLKKRIGKMAKSVSLAAPHYGKGIGNSYTAWTLFELAGVLKTTGQNVLPKDLAGGTPKTFVVRGAPGYILPSSPAQLNRPCHFEIGNATKRKVELHASIRHLGMSEDDHELDLSVMPKVEVDEIRMKGGGVYVGSRLVGVELKAYDAAAQLNKNIPRAFCALAVDLDRHLLLPHFSVVAGRAYAFPAPTSLRYALLTTASVAEASKRYLDHYGIAFGENVCPSHAAPLYAVAAHIAHLL
jgi:hypothetical protein